MDMDCICVRQLPEVVYAFETQPVPSNRVTPFFFQRKVQFSNAVLKCPAGDPHLQRLIPKLRALLNKGITDWEAVLVLHATHIIDSGLEDFLAPTVWFGALVKSRMPPEYDSKLKNGSVRPGLSSIRKGSLRPRLRDRTDEERLRLRSFKYCKNCTRKERRLYCVK